MSDATAALVGDGDVAGPSTSSGTSTPARKISKVSDHNSNSNSAFKDDNSQTSRDSIARKHVEMTAERITEYQWPESSGEYYFIQEQITQFLDIKSFKRKYPEFPRRALDVQERIMLQDMGVIDTLQADLGLTALRSEDVMELMAKEYPKKYCEYLAAVESRQQLNYASKVSVGYQQPSIDKSKMGEFIKKTLKSVSEYNQHLNAERKEERRASMDLQTYIMHYPIGLGKENRQLMQNIKKGRVRDRRGRFPVALYPWQYQDWYLKYTPEELKYFPINTVLYGPVVTDPTKLPPLLTSAEESSGESDSDSDGLSDDEDGGSCCGSSPSREASSSPRKDDPIGPTPKRPRRSTARLSAKVLLAGAGKADQAGSDSSSSGESSSSDSEAEPTGPPPAPVLMKDFSKARLNAVCRICQGNRMVNKQKEPEELVHCSDCEKSAHPTCFEFTPEMVDVIKSYPWQCSECKACIQCGKAHDEEKMMFCDKCDRGYHTFCVGLSSIPNGKWVCSLCAQCAQCGATTPVPLGSDGAAGDGSDLSMDAIASQWQHETIKISLNGDTMRRHQLFCHNCYKSRRK